MTAKHFHKLDAFDVLLPKFNKAINRATIVIYLYFQQNKK